MAIKVKGFFLVQKRSLSSPVGGVHWDGRGEIRSPPPVVQIGTKICVVGTGIRVAAAGGITGGVAVTSLGMTDAPRVQEIFNKNRNNPANIIRIDLLFIAWPPNFLETRNALSQTLISLLGCHCESISRSQQSPVWRGDCLPYRYDVAALAPLGTTARNDMITTKQLYMIFAIYILKRVSEKRP